MEEPLLTKPEGKDVLLKSPATTLIGPPPSKKLKQARLPFAPKQANSSPAPIASKKRKLSDGSKNEKQPTKQAKSDENADKEVILIEDNEVSSSSEAEHAKNKHGKQEKPKKTIMDMFNGIAQQSEVSTSSASPESSQVLKIGDDAAEEQMDAESSNAAKSDVEVKKENTDSKKKDQKEVAKDIKSTEKETNSSEEADDTSEKDEVEDENSNDDKENVSLLSTTGVDESIMETSDVEDEGSGTEADTSVNEGTDVDAGSSSLDKSKTGESTSSGTKDPKKFVISEKKKAEREAAKQRKKEKLEKEKEEKLVEKQKQKEERMKQRQEEKEKKEQDKQAIIDKKNKEKQEKMEQKEKEKEEKNKQKEEEKKKKMEAIEAKNEEKKKKDEDRKKKDDEKKQAEEEELMKKQKVKQAFASFFKKVDKPAVQPKTQQKSSGLFMEFEPKKNMRLAPVVRYSLPEADKTSLDKEMQEQTCKALYVEQLRAKEIKPRRDIETWAWEDDELEIVDEETQQEKRMKAKFLYFHANYRPPYYGTWRKKSSQIKPRRPLGQDTVLLDYEVDSDDEWEEEEPGESLSNSEGEDEEETKGEGEEADADDDDEDDDGFFVPHGYLSEGEGCENEDDEDCTPERLKARQLAKAKAFEDEMKQKCKALRAFFIGCQWWTPEGSSDPNYKKLTEFTAVTLPSAATGAIEVTPSNIKSGAQEASPSSSKIRTPKEVGETRGAMRKSVPDEAMPELIRLVHGNRASIQKLIREFREFWSKKTSDQEQLSTTSVADTSQDTEAMDTSLNNPSEGNTSICTPGTSEGTKCSISKRQCDITIRSIANYSKKEGFPMKCWYVNEEVLKKHQLTDLPVPTEWVWLTRNNIKRPEEEPSTPGTPSGRETPTPVAQSSSTPVLNSITKFTVPKSQLPSPQVEPSTPKSRESAPNAQNTTPKATSQDKLTPKNLMSIKSAFAAVPKSKVTLSTSEGPKKEVKKDCKPVDDDDDDCMIIDDDSTEKPTVKSQSSS